MKKPLLTDRTKLYIGLTRFYEEGTYTLAPCADNTDNRLNLHATPMAFIVTDNSPLSSYHCICDPIGGPLTLTKLADVIRTTKVDGYTHLLVSERTFIWAKLTPAGFIGSNGRQFGPNSRNYYNHKLEWFEDWRETLPLLKSRLEKRLQEIREAWQAQYLKYKDFLDAQAAIDNSQAIIIRCNNKRFKGIPY